MRRFLCDAMLGTLTTYLRMCGYDTAYALDRDVEDEDELRSWAAEEQRTLLTRDRTLAEQTSDAILLTAHAPADQLTELANAGIELALPDEPIRCSHCNGRLAAVGPEEPRPDYAPDQEERPVWRCMTCGQFFWRGSHWEDLGNRLPDESATP
ncbi:MAG: Mut7-C RNAse domain-containing protein [Salinirussus sp.]